MLTPDVRTRRAQIGNAVLNDATDQLGMVEYAWSHAIISDELYSAVRRDCDSFKEEADGGRPGKGCSPALRAFLGAYDDIDIYSIYTPTCLLSNLSSASAAAGSARPRPARLVAAPRLLSKHVRYVRRLCECGCCWHATDLPAVARRRSGIG
jgi:serine carboxypeptidase-like clade II